MGIQLPPEPQDGDALQASWGRQVVRYLRAITLQRSPDVAPKTLAGGTTLKSLVSGGGKLPPPPEPPFLELIDVSTHHDDGTINVAKVRVVAGDVGGQIPDVFGAGDAPIYTFTPSGDGQVWSHYVVDPADATATPTTNSIGHGASMPASDPATGVYYTSIGSYSVGSHAVAVANTCHGPITAQLCLQYYTAPQLYQLTMVPS